MGKSGPWLQKPLHATFADIEPSSPNVSSERRPMNRNSSYDSIQDAAMNSDVSITSSIRSIQRHLSLFDLVNIGVGGTIGSGIFVLCGFIAHRYAGPAVSLCWVISGAAACLSGICYAELACRLPAAGSSYVYVYASMGELPAVLVAACLTLEYVVSGAAVARSWGDKMVRWMSEDLHVIENEEKNFFNPGFDFNPLAAMISAASVILLMNGVKESKSVTNFFTITKVLLVSFMALIGMILMKPEENLQPFLPPQYGWAGVFRGATSSFFGYIGFDELACMAHEAVDPQKNMPLSIVYTLGIVTVLYVAAALALTGMQPYEEISDVSGFPAAFHARGWDWAAQIAACGEVFTLPIVVLISIMAQPRLQYALAKDGLLPKIFAKVDRHGNLWWGTVIAGIAMVIIAAFIPFDNLNDMISAGILVAFAMTDASLILMRYDSPDDDEELCDRLVGWLNIASFAFSVSVTHFWDFAVGKFVTLVFAFKLFQCIFGLAFKCTPALTFGGKTRKSNTSEADMDMSNSGYFKTPCMPYIPAMGIFVNWYLIAQLELSGIGLLLIFLASVCIFYFLYGRKNSVGNNGGWELDNNDDASESATLSLPPLA
ncbi:hypothetical protein CTEN210_03870 [Chaetoceros tenuissimus]|uniref:Cationic amino acid transporter C-terminal domain-containing protein n=1 Tax=Chaetoceros tenuissimus TaxID=426638 RepID=A0AAD3CLR6_9STRA|nr:hypothetical protein CTEN210_03870 [Chaetoceros tenuissimus]